MRATCQDLAGRGIFNPQFLPDTAAGAHLLFDTGGRDAVTLRAISKELGCSPMQPYRYFPGGKQEILAEVKTRAFNHFAAHQEGVLADGVANDIDLVELNEALHAHN